MGTEPTHPCPFCDGGSSAPDVECVCDDGEISRFMRMDDDLLGDRERPSPEYDWSPEEMKERIKELEAAARMGTVVPVTARYNVFD